MYISSSAVRVVKFYAVRILLKYCELHELRKSYFIADPYLTSFRLNNKPVTRLYVFLEFP